MSCNCRLIVLILVLILNLNAQESHKIDNTAMILVAMDKQSSGEYKFSQQLYIRLLEDNNKYEYLQAALSMSMKINDYDTILTLTAKYKNIFQEHEENLCTLEILALSEVSELNMALKYAYELLDKYNNAKSYELVANILYQMEEYEESLSYYESAYASNKNAKTLLSLVDVLFTYLNQKNTAIAYLETYIGIHDCDTKVCERLLIYYQELSNTNGMVSILKKIYKKVYLKSQKDGKKYKALDKITNTIIEILKLNDIKSAIIFLEENNIYDIRLLSLYHQNKEYDKALLLTRKLYLKTKDIKFLAQLATLEYELSSSKKDVLNTVIANFNIVLDKSDNPSYQNYFGYILIDNDIDISRGIKLVNMALKQDPDNIAFQDSLAWGYYKLHQCKKAMNIIQGISDSFGLDDKELQKHYKVIKECR
jgi:tetratricopeptide (TPR) repeat protein